LNFDFDLLKHTRYIPGVATPGSEEEQIRPYGLANCQSVKKPIETFLVLLRPVLNALIVAESMTLCFRGFHRSITR